MTLNPALTQKRAFFSTILGALMFTALALRTLSFVLAVLSRWGTGDHHLTKTERHSWLGWWLTMSFRSLFPSQPRACAALCCFVLSHAIVDPLIMFLETFFGGAAYGIDGMASLSAGSAIPKDLAPGAQKFCLNVELGSRTVRLSSVLVGLWAGQMFLKNLGEDDKKHEKQEKAKASSARRVSHVIGSDEEHSDDDDNDGGAKQVLYAVCGARKYLFPHH